MTTLQQLQEWMDMIATDLDPQQQWARPCLELKAFDESLPYRGWYNAGTNTVRVVVGSPYREDRDLLATLAHEMRHWHQRHSGRLADGYAVPLAGAYLCVGIWDGEAHHVMVECAADLDLVPWEKDADEYAEQVGIWMQKRKAAA